MMTLTEVFTELKACETKVKQLQKEVLAETDKNIAMAKLDEMIRLARRAAELDTLHKTLLNAKLNAEVKRIFQKYKTKNKAL